MVLTLLMLVLAAYFLIQTTPVQNWLVQKVTNTISKDLGTKVLIKKVDFSLFNKMQLEGTYVEDKNKDTLLYAGRVHVQITDWFFTKDVAVLEAISLENATVYLHRKDSVWNYQHLIDYFSAPASSNKKSKSIELKLKQLQLSNINFIQRDEWRGEDLALQIRSLLLNAKELNFNKKLVDIAELKITEPIFSIYNYDGHRPKRMQVVNTGVVHYNSLRWNPQEWKVQAKLISIENGAFKSDVQMVRPVYYYFDENHIVFSSINAHIKEVNFQKDTIKGQLQLSTQERSGFTVQKLASTVTLHPELMEFNNLDIQTPRSRLTNYFSMRYNSFDEMSDFIEKVTMKGTFRNAVIHSDDIAYFAPELEKWKRNIELTGTINGTVENLNGKSIILEAGKSTSLNGDIQMKGLPDIDKTFINFRSNNFRTTYTDAITLVPILKTVTDLRLDRLQYLRFKGNYTGFLKNFVAFGTIETALGTVLSDVNMKFPENSPTEYTGKINTVNFKIGDFINNTQLGKVSFNGTVKGSGLSLKTLNANLDGNINNLDYNGYTYKNITAKGTLKEKQFNGNLAANDPNLGLQLDGLVDFNKQEPRFDFFAKLDRANFKRLNLYREDIDMSGNFRFNFTGSEIDNFLGTARISEASLFKDGRRISFDSLSIESKKTGNNKSIVVMSNEFDAAIAGEFSIKELPIAFQTFLNRYYPSYIKPSKKKLTDENFSFIITTKKVDDYMDIFDKNLRGFNNTNLSGRINTKENLFDLDADVPQFSYNNTTFYNASLKGRGNMDSLAITSSIGNVRVNDSLHFPGTKISIRSANDVSKVSVSTSANQTLNAADVSGTLTTLPNGFSVVFNPSTFDVNGKRWTIDKNSELTLSKSLVTSDGLKIYNGDQEIFVSSQPSSRGESGTDLLIELKKVNLGDFTPFFIKSNRIEGIISGQVEVNDPFGKTLIDVTADAEQFRLDDDSIGKLQITSSYMKKSGRINVYALSENEEYNFDLNGFINTLDSTGTGIDIVTHPKKMNIHFLEKYLTGIFSQVKGYASGDLRITGKANNLKYLGNLTLTDGSLLVDYTQCRYYIPQAVIKMEEDGINFGNFTLKDDLNNTGELLYGKLYHNNFDDMAYDFRLKTNKMLLLNTQPVHNKQFYGRAIGRANLSFTGPMEAMEMEIEAEATDSSFISLPIGNSSQVKGEPNFLTWKVYGTEMQADKKDKSSSNLNVTMDMIANKFATINVILDQATDDQITAIGHGKIRLTSTKDDLSLNGRFDVDQGKYKFSFQSVPRNFELKKNVSNYITWNKAPYDADLKISAVYRVDRARFRDLELSQGNNAGQNDAITEELKNYQGPVEVVANISQKLQNPKIKFDLQVPENDGQSNSQAVNYALETVKRNENELNKQVSMLVVFNNFAPISSSRNNTASSYNIGRQALEGIVLNTISGFISSELTKYASNFFQNVFKDPSIKVNFNAAVYSNTAYTDLSSTGNTNTIDTRSTVNLSFSKDYFNDRLTFIVGSALDFGISGTATNTNTRSFQFLPDVTARLKLTPDGKFLASFFYRQNSNYLGSAFGKQSRSGASISYRKEFEKFSDFFKKKEKEQKKTNDDSSVRKTAITKAFGGN